jgi:hypothetical protein
VSEDLELSRLEELVCDAALSGLSAEERAELDALAPDGAPLEGELELLLGEITAVVYDRVREHAPPRSTMSDALKERLYESMTSAPSQAQAPKLRLVDGGAARNPSPQAPESERPKAAEPQAAGATNWLPWLVAAAAVLLAVAGWGRGSSTPSGTVATGPQPTGSQAQLSGVEPPASAMVPPPASARAPSGPPSRDQLLGLQGTAKLDFKATQDTAAKGATGDVVWHGGLQHGYMRIAGLEANDPTRVQYQLWIFDADRDDKFPVDGGVFDVSKGGEALVPISAKLKVGRPKLFAITAEKPGGVVVSKRERIVLTAAPPS